MQNTLSVVKIVEKALGEIQDNLEKMRELSARAAAEDLTSAERAVIQKDIDHHIAEIDRIAAETESKTAAFTSGPSTGIH